MAAKSLKQSIENITSCIDNNQNKNYLNLARKELSRIVGRDVDNLNEEEILRAAAESASENAVDGIFAPFFWMIIGLFAWKLSNQLPGPLALSWSFKASSTIDSMLGYKYKDLRWLGESGAYLDDILTFIPCRLVLISLPFISRSWIKAPSLIKKAWQEGSQDASPNSGISEAIFANCVSIRMGGETIYRGKSIIKPTFAANSPIANTKSIKKILALFIKLQAFWILITCLILYIFS